MSIFLICPHAGHPRYHKRERSLRSLCSTKVAAFLRPHYRDNSFDDSADVLRLGELEHRKYLARLPRLWQAVRRIRPARAPADVMYAFGPDSYVLGRLAGFGRGILEIGDLRTIDTRNPVAHALERAVLQDCRALVLTSPGFVDGYYRRRLPRECPTYLIENKLSVVFRGGRREFDFQTPQVIRIGLIGMLRYRRPIEMLVRAVRENPRFRLMCYGDGPDRDVIEANVGERIEYFGQFRNPQELDRIYRSVDVNFVVYNSASGNVRLALPNKYYESIFFGVPLLAAQGTELARQVAAAGVGGVVDTSNYDSFLADLNRLSPSWIAARRHACLQIPEQQLLDDGQEVLGRMLRELGILGAA